MKISTINTTIRHGGRATCDIEVEVLTVALGKLFAEIGLQEFEAQERRDYAQNNLRLLQNLNAHVTAVDVVNTANRELAIVYTDALPLFCDINNLTNRQITERLIDLVTNG